MANTSVRHDYIVQILKVNVIDGSFLPTRQYVAWHFDEDQMKMETNFMYA